MFTVLPMYESYLLPALVKKGSFIIVTQSILVAQTCPGIRKCSNAISDAFLNRFYPQISFFDEVMANPIFIFTRSLVKKGSARIQYQVST